MPNDVKPYQIPFFPFRIQASETATGNWRTERPELLLECEESRTKLYRLWPLMSFRTEATDIDLMAGFRKGGWLRFIVFSSFDNRPGNREAFVSPPFQEVE